jgi:hypothetical protein
MLLVQEVEAVENDYQAMLIDTKIAISELRLKMEQSR